MLSKKAQYAFRALEYLVEHQDEGPVLIATIAKKKKIPLKFLENILLELRKASFLESKKGKGGGYYLAKAPEKIPVAAIIRTVDGPIAMLPCVSLYFYKRCKNCDEKHCGLHDIMEGVRDATLAILEKKSLADLVREGK
ncbi:MAG: Rrf2 family transcriptional regulator [Chitinophagaceae bacterium]|nr:Rrf2 family transcriptional regulator [Chitinophagaceae bacterium]